MLVIESLDSDTEIRRLSPIALIANPGDLLNQLTFLTIKPSDFILLYLLTVYLTVPIECVSYCTYWLCF